MKNIIFVLVFVASLVFGKCWAQRFELPSFLPEYYSTAFEVGGSRLNLIKNATTDNVDQWIYSTKDQSIRLVIENIKCGRPSSRSIFNNILGYLNKEIGDKRGEFLEISEEEIHARIVGGGVEKTVFVYVVPASIHIWTFSMNPRLQFQPEASFEAIRAMANRQRYTDALSEGNVAMGLWGSHIYEYASGLLRQGKKNTALNVFENLLRTSPFNYAAHVDFMENSNNLEAAANSAKIVLREAEDPDLLDKAARFSKVRLNEFNSIPFLEEQEKGLQLILIPLAPCSIWLLEESAQTYEKITGIPTKIRRLKEEWFLSTPDRIPYQRRIQEILVTMKKKNVDFTGWTKERYIKELMDTVESEDASSKYHVRDLIEKINTYIKELMNTVESEDALSKYYVRDLIEKINTEPGQYLVDPHLDWFCNILEKHRSSDHRTMYVGITEANVYSGDNNYVFSLGRPGGPSRASILSYHMMLAKTLSEEYQSRQRLTERIAKELVPASIKQLGIPRSTDPTCPYSYSSGVARLDQKTLNLSDNVKEALKIIIIQP